MKKLIENINIALIFNKKTITYPLLFLGLFGIIYCYIYNASHIYGISLFILLWLMLSEYINRLRLNYIKTLKEKYEHAIYCPECSLRITTRKVEEPVCYCNYTKIEE
jgi:uncharacterized membrane protein